MTRGFWVLVHRWAGLVTGLFLAVAGLTGTILAFDPWLYEWLNPDLTHVPVRAEPMLDPFTLRERALALSPGSRIDAVMLNGAPGEVVPFILAPSAGDPSNPVLPEFSMLFLDPYTGRAIAREKVGGLWPVTRRNFTQVVFAFHAALALGNVGGWILGLSSLVWIFTTLAGVYLTLPRPAPARASPRERRRPSWWSRWRTSWLFVLRGRALRVQFNLHRAAGLWMAPLLFVLAVSSVSFNLPQLYGPFMKTVFGMRDARDRIPDLKEPLVDPVLGWREAAAIGARLTGEEAKKRGFRIAEAPGSMWMTWDAAKGVFAFPSHGDRDVGYHTPGSVAYVDGRTGELRGIEYASGDHAAKTFTSWIGAIHGCTVGGIPMHVVVGLSGLVTAALAFTGAWLLIEKRRLRVRAAQAHP